jgi:hypothetical protein
MRPRLKEDIADRIDHGTVDLLWLRNEWGIAFRGIDYGQIRPDDAILSERFPAKDALVEDICHVDVELRDRLVMVALEIFGSRVGAGNIT